MKVTVTKSHIEPLRIIRMLVEDLPVSEEFSRDFLLKFAKKHFPEEDPELVADCLIAAGFGNDAEQTQTVYCRASYG